MALHQSTLDTLKKYADIHVQSAKQTFGYELDYSAQSVALLDTMITDGWKGETPQNIAGVVGFFGAYLGEVICRQLAGQWLEDQEAFVVNIKLADGHDLKIPVFDKVKSRFLNGNSASLQLFYQGLTNLK